MTIEQVMELVDEDYYVRKEDGKLLTQTTAKKAIANGLGMLNAQKGQRILEIGTGSGYSTALLANLVGKKGKVVSIDIDPKLTVRAQQKLVKYTWIECITGDGRYGNKKAAPYDRIIAWTTPDTFPDEWRKQIAEKGVIVAPFHVLSIANSTLMVRLKNNNGVLKGDLVGPEGYIPMTSEPVVNFFGPEIHADVMGKEEDPFWAGSYWMKALENEEWNRKFLQAQPEESPFKEESGQDIRAYLLGKNPEGYTFAFHPMYGFWVGFSSSNGFALVSYHQSNQWIITDQYHAEVLQAWWQDWENSGKPSYEDLKPQLIDNTIKVKLKNEGGR